METIKVKIDLQGAPVLSDSSIEYGAWVYKSSTDILVIILDTSSKYCEVGAIMGFNGIPGIAIEANENTLYTSKSHNVNDLTAVSFPALKNWDIWCCEASKYSIKICLTRDL